MADQLFIKQFMLNQLNKINKQINKLTFKYIKQLQIKNPYKKIKKYFLQISNKMKSRSSSKLTNTMLTQLQQNEYLRVKLIQLEQVSRQKDNFYLSIFREQQKVTQKMMKELILAEEKIKELIKARICNNWKQEYDTLAESVGSYVKDVNQLIESYMKTKQALQQKTYKNSGLYQYYSNTLQQCGKKFDQAQIIIEQLNSQINQYKQTIIDIDENLEQKLKTIAEQQHQIIALNEQLDNYEKNKQNMDVEFDNLKREFQSIQQEFQKREDIIKSQYEKEFLEMEDKQKQEVKSLLKALNQKDINVSNLNNEIVKLKYQLSLVQNEINLRNSFSQAKMQDKNKFKISNIKKQGSLSQYGSKFKENEAINQQNSIYEPQQEQRFKIFNFSQNQLHLRKIVEQQQRIKTLQKQDQYYKKNLLHLEQQNQKLISSQRQYLHRENYHKQEIQNLKSKITNMAIQIQVLKDDFQQQKNKLQFERDRLLEEQQEYMLEKQGLLEEIKQLNKKKQTLNNDKQSQTKQKQIINKQIQIIQQQKQLIKQQKNYLKSQFQKLFKQFQQFVKQSQELKSNQLQLKKQPLTVSNKQLNQKILILGKKLIPFQNSPSNKKRNLKISIPQNQNNFFDSSCQLKEKDIKNDQNCNVQTPQNKKFNLHNFQQKTTSHLITCFSPKVGDIFHLNNTFKNIGHRW